MLRAVRKGSMVSRRSVLAGGALLVTGALVGCTTGDEPEPEPSGSPDPDVTALRAALAREDELIAAYAAAGAGQAGPQAAGLAEFVTRHEVHRDAILAALAAADAPATATATATSRPTSPTADPGQLAQLEAAAAAAGRDAANEVGAADLAGLLAAIAAAENANSVELTA